MASRKYGVVYTPNRLAQFVAELLLDEMHLDKMQIKSILDPACGECALLNAVEKLAGNAIQYYGIDVDKDVLNGNYENKKIIINDSILPKNVRQNTEIYWRKRVNRIQAIIANPPWSSEKIYDRELLRKAGFSLINGQYDSYVLFIELAYKLLDEGGYFAFILPDSLFDSQNIFLREFLVKNTEIKVIARLGEKIFEEVNRATTVIVCKKTVPSFDSKTKCFRLSTEERKQYLGGEKNLMQSYFEGMHVVSQNRFANNEAFIFDIDTKENEEKLIEKIKKNSIKWQEHFIFGRGVEISKTGKIVFCQACGCAQGYKKKQLQSGKKICSLCGKEISITENVIESVVSKYKTTNSVQICVGEDVNRYRVNHSSYIKKDIPGINYKNMTLYQPPKILVRKTGLGIYAAVDYSGGMTSQTVYILKQKTKINIPLEYYLAMLNSRVVYYYYLKVYGENEWKSHPYLTKQIIFSLPISKYDGGMLDQEIITIARSLMVAYDYQLDIQLENKIFQKYQLSKEEIELIAEEINKLPDLSAINNMKFEVSDNV